MKKFLLLVFIVLVSLNGLNVFADLFQYDANGKRDPFVPVRITRGEKDLEIGGKLEEISKKEIGGVVWDDESPLAIVEDEILSEGDIYLGARVKKIKETEVIFEYRGKELTLKVKEFETLNVPSKPVKGK